MTSKKNNNNSLSRERSSPDTRRRTHFPAMANRIDIRSETENENENRKIEKWINQKKRGFAETKTKTEPETATHTRPKVFKREEQSQPLQFRVDLFFLFLSEINDSLFFLRRRSFGVWDRDKWRNVTGCWCWFLPLHFSYFFITFFFYLFFFLWRFNF